MCNRTFYEEVHFLNVLTHQILHYHFLRRFVEAFIVGCEGGKG